MKRTLLFALLVALLIVPIATGSKTNGTSTIALAGTATYASTITFDVSSDQTDAPFVHLRCYQDGTLVAEGWQGFFPTALGSRAFGLYSPAWTGGAADCTADLDMSVRVGPNGPVWKVLASTAFHVDA